MNKVDLKPLKKLQTLILLILCVNVWGLSDVYAFNTTEDETEVEIGGDWDEEGTRSTTSYPISVCKTTQYIIIQDNNPVNTITVKITSNETGAVVFENGYPQGHTNYIAISLNEWSVGSYTIEMFGRENNGYLCGIFHVLP